MIISITIGYYVFKLNNVIAFWRVYILTRLLSASLGDFLSQAHKNEGLELVVYLTANKKRSSICKIKNGRGHFLAKEGAF